ncbi:MAG: MFS transporter [Chloroflexota bacterium]
MAAAAGTWGKGRPHYAWVVLACAIAIGAVSSGVRMSFGVLIDPLAEQYGWSRGAISGASSVMFLSSIPLLLGAGLMADRMGARRICLVAATGTATGMFLTGTMTHLWQFYLYYGFLLGGFAMIFVVVLPVLLMRWFHRRAGLALGLVWAAMAVGAMTAPPILRWLISSAGWRQAFFLTGIAASAVMFVAVFFLRGHPREVGTVPYGAMARTSAPDAEGPPPRPTLTLGQVRRTSAFWHLINLHFLGCVGHSIILVHVVSMAIRAGVPGLTAAGVLSAMAGASIAGRLASPMVAERLGGRKTFALVFLLQGLPVFLLFWADLPWQFYLFALVFGPGYGGETPPFPVVSRQYYGANSPLNSINGWQLAGAQVGMALGAWLGGALFDLTGTYAWSIAAAAIFTLAGLWSVRALPTHRPGEVVLAPAGRGAARGGAGD